MDIGTISRNGSNYETVIASEYVRYLKSIGARTISAEKNGYVIARKAVPGETVKVYVSNGNLEVTETAAEGQWLLTRADHNGEPVIDKFGHKNQWLVGEEIFQKKYDVQNIASNGLTKPLCSPQTFIETDRDIAIMVPWGENGSLVPQTIERGGFLNIEDSEAIYGIAKDELFETYAVRE